MAESAGTQRGAARGREARGEDSGVPSGGPQFSSRRLLESGGLRAQGAPRAPPSQGPSLGSAPPLLQCPWEDPAGWSLAEQASRRAGLCWEQVARPQEDVLSGALLHTAPPRPVGWSAAPWPRPLAASGKHPFSIF